MRIAATLVLSLVSSVVWACSAAGGVVEHPSEVTLESALRSVGAGLYDMSVAQRDVTTGLLPAEVTVTFNVSVSATDSSKLVVDVASLPVGGGTGKVGGDIGSTTTAQRGNQITVKFTNLLYSTNGKLVFMKTPEDIGKLLKALKEAGVHVYVQ